MKGRALKIDKALFVPRYNVERYMLTLLPAIMYERLIKEPESYLICTRVTLWKLRFQPYDTVPGKAEWYPNLKTLINVKDFLNRYIPEGTDKLTLNSLLNDDKVTITPVTQLKLLLNEATAISGISTAAPEEPGRRVIDTTKKRRNKLIKKKRVSK